MKKLLLLLFALAAVSLASSAATYKGDANCDGAINGSDINIMIDIALGKADYIIAADANGDGVVDGSDINYAINVTLGKQDPEPFEEPGGDEVFSVNGVEFKVIYVEGGTFTMGSNTAVPGSYMSYNANYHMPEHQVTVSSFKMMEFEVSHLLYKQLMPYAPMDADAYHYNDYVRHCVDTYSEYYTPYDSAVAFAEKLSELTGRHFRLPTEAEWEFAARGGNLSEGHLYPGGDDVYTVANVHTSSAYLNWPTQGLKKPNELGLYDMAGNVSEWCSDPYCYYTEDAQVNPTRGAGEYVPNYYGVDSENIHVMRGGTCDSFPYEHWICAVYARIGTVNTRSEERRVGKEC